MTPVRPAVASVSPIDVGLAFATVVIGLAVVVRLLFLVPVAS